MSFYLVDSTSRRENFDNTFQRVTDNDIDWESLAPSDVVFAHSTDFPENQPPATFTPIIDSSLTDDGIIAVDAAIRRIRTLREKLNGLSQEQKPWFVLYMGYAVNNPDTFRMSLANNALPGYPSERVFVIQIQRESEKEQIKTIVGGIIEAIQNSGTKAVAYYEAQPRLQDALIALHLFCEAWLLKGHAEITLPTDWLAPFKDKNGTLDETLFDYSGAVTKIKDAAGAAKAFLKSPNNDDVERMHKVLSEALVARR